MVRRYWRLCRTRIDRQIPEDSLPACRRTRVLQKVQLFCKYSAHITLAVDCQLVCHMIDHITIVVNYMTYERAVDWTAALLRCWNKIIRQMLAAKLLHISVKSPALPEKW